MKLSGLLKLSGKEWANKLNSLDGKIDGVFVSVIEEKNCKQGDNPGEYSEVISGYRILFITDPEKAKGFKSRLATLNLDPSKTYSTLDLNFEMHWEPQKSNVISAIYSNFDSRLKNKR